MRNEAHIIERCLDAALPVLDAVDICDTGSTDDTVAAVTRWLERTGVPGRIRSDPFVDFASSRTRALEWARQTATGLGWSAAATYLLLLDADMVLDVRPTFNPAALDADVYDVLQRNGALEYANVRLVRASLPVIYIGATHEYVSVPDGATTGHLPTLRIVDTNDGGSRGDKLDRDRRLLEGELTRDPSNVRAMFYLAQTFHGLGDRPKALFWYARRTRAGGWHEEAWYAGYAIGVLLAESGDVRGAIGAFVRALRADPSRPEPYGRLATLLRCRGHHRWALRLARAGLHRGVSPGRRLFLDRRLLDWGLLTEVAISAYYAGDRAAGLEANEQVALGLGAPDDLAALALQNAVFYAGPLLDADYRRLEPPLPPYYVPCNPSILPMPDGYLVNCRAVSYRIDADQRFTALEPDGIHRTRNFLLRLNREGHVLTQEEVRSVETPIREWAVRGLEDCRLIAEAEAGQGGLAFTCTTTDLHPDGPVRVSLFSVGEGAVAADHRPLRGYGDGQTQKNWLPFRDGRALRAIYGYEPFVVLAVDERTGACSPLFERPQGRPFGAFRGSAGPVRLSAEHGGGWLLLVHCVAVHDARRTYLHRFLRVDQAGCITAASRPFYFRHLGVEFACGACLSHAGDELLVTLGLEDREAWICRVPLASVVRALRPLPPDRSA